MKTRLLNLWDDFRESFWFVPALLSLIAIPIALGTLELDRWIIDAGIEVAPFVRDAAASRQILSSVASVVVTLAGVVFSVTLVAISMASSQFGSRLLRCYMTDSIGDRVIGMLSATSVFCSIVLPQVREETERTVAFVPQISTTVATLLGFVSVGLLIWFVHDTALSIQAPRLIAAVAADLDEAVARLLPPPNDDSPVSDHVIPTVDQNWPELGSFAVLAQSDGYVQGVGIESLVLAAKRTNTIIEFLIRPGHFVCTTSPLAKVYIQNADNAEDDWRSGLESEIHAATFIGFGRTPRQDVSCSIIELVEVATRALSPGINNPFAAMNCIDRLGATLSRIASRRFPPDEHFDDDGRVRCVMRTVTFPNLLGDAFDQIRQYGCGSVAVAIRLIEVLCRIAREACREDDLAAIRTKADAVRTAFLASEPARIDIEDFDRRFQQLKQIWE